MRTGLVLASLLSSATAFAADPPPKPGALALCNQIIDLKVAQVGSSLGPKVGPMTFVNDGFCWQAFTKGRIHTGTLTSSVTVVITGSVLAKFSALGYEAGFGQAFAPINDANGVVRHPYKQGFIVVHPSFGTRGIKNPLAALWNDNNTTARFGYPTSDLLATPNGGYNLLERGYVARTNEMGSWIDFTGAGEGRTLAEVKLYRDWYLAPASPLIKVLAGESPVSLRAQFGTFDGQVSSLTFKAPQRTSLYLFDESPLEGRYTRITGADQARIQVQALGTWMNDRPSSMMLVNHGSASSPMNIATLQSAFKTWTDAMDTTSLLRFLNADLNATGRFGWANDLAVHPIPGSRLLEVSRSAFLGLGDCSAWDELDCDGMGQVMFTTYVRPRVAMIQESSNPSVVRPTVMFDFVEGVATSLGCTSDFGCDERNDALDVMFDYLTVQNLFIGAFNSAVDQRVQALRQPTCGDVGARRVNVLPDRLEIVIADATAPAECMSRSQSAGFVESVRLPARITNHNADGSAAIQFNGIYNVVPDFTLIVPPPVFN